MQCYICVTYMIFFCTAHPSTDRQLTTQPQKRSLFNDVIESLRIRAQLPDDLNLNENNLQSYVRYGYENEQPMPSDADFVPRRNDRIEMPFLKYRFPKSLNETEESTDGPKEEIVLYIDTTREPKPTTQKLKKQKRPNPTRIKNKNQNKLRDDEVEDNYSQKPEEYLTNTMGGQSQIGNRESQMIVKPTVIVNIRGSVTHRDGEIKMEGRNHNETTMVPESRQNIFNIKQEINLERTFPSLGSRGVSNKMTIDENYKKPEKEKPKLEEDMMMCETATWNLEKNREGRNYESVLQILFSL